MILMPATKLKKQQVRFHHSPFHQILLVGAVLFTRLGSSSIHEPARGRQHLAP